MKDIGIIGAGRIGTCLGKVASKNDRVILYDKDIQKAVVAAKKCHAQIAQSMDEVLNNEIIILALPGEAIRSIFSQYYTIASRNTLWVNISTFITFNELKSITAGNPNLLSCKIIGEADRLNSDQKIVVIFDQDSLSGLTSQKEYVLRIFRQIGQIICDDENKYLKINYYAAEAAMRSVVMLAEKLDSLHCDPEIIKAAVLQVFIGTAEQFPYKETDYFHELVFAHNRDLKKKLDDLNNRL